MPSLQSVGHPCPFLVIVSGASSREGKGKGERESRWRRRTWRRCGVVLAVLGSRAAAAVLPGVTVSAGQGGGGGAEARGEADGAERGGVVGQQ
jgi:hypothetical protein